MNKPPKMEAKNEIEEFFRNIKNKSSREIRKIKKLAMNYNLPLKNLRKTFCKKCLNPYSGNEKIKINNGIKNTICEHCGFVSRWKINSS
jgi:RNase P subunit RPR2